MNQLLRVSLSILGVATLILCTASTVAAQNTGIIEGVVTDESGGVLPGATLSLKNAETGAERSAISDVEGRYRFPALPPGTFTVRTELQGFNTEERQNITLTIGLTVRHDFSLKIQTLSESVTVVAEAPVVDVTRSEVAGVVTQKQIESLPINTRQYLNLALLMPGTSQDAVRVFYNNVNVGAGGSFYSNGFVADDVSNTWAEQGEPRQNFPQDSIREFKVNTTQFKAEYGLATGGLVTVVSKSGTNELHGNAFEYFRHKSLNAMNYFEQAKPNFDRHQFGVSLGGPIRRDRMHVFGAIERTVTDEFFTVATGQPALYAAVEGTFPQPRRVTLGSLRVDNSLSEKHNLFVKYAHEEEFSVCAGSTCGGRNAANAGYDMEIPRRSAVVGHTWLVSDRLLNDFRFQYAYAAYQIAPTGTPIFKKVGEYTPERLARIQRRYQFPSLIYGGNYEALGPEHRWQFKDSVSLHVPDWGGSHDWKAGIDFSHIPFSDDSQVNLNGTYQFGADQYFDPNSAASVASLQNPILFTMTAPPAYTSVPTQHLGLYIQDDWRPVDNLTINLGLRYDRQFGSFNENLDVARFRVPIPFIDVSQRGDANNFGPRAGFAYDFSGTGRTVIRGGYGLYYDNVRTLANFGEWRNLERYDIRITNPPYPDPFLGRDPILFASSAPANITVLSNDNFKSPYSHQSNIGFTRQLGATLAVHVDGVYTVVRDDRKTQNINLANAATGLRPYPEWGRVDLEESLSRANYRGLYVRLDKRASDRYQYLVSYSLVKSNDNAPSARFTNQADRELDWGPSNAERRHGLAASGAVLLPFEVQFGAVWTLRSSLPFSAVAGRDLNGDGFVTDWVPGTTRNQGSRDLDLQLVNAWRATLGLAPVTADGIDSTRFTSVDLRASKSIPVGGSRRVEVLAQVFNTFNTVNFSALQDNTSAATFGTASRAGAGRQAELGVRFIW